MLAKDESKISSFIFDLFLMVLLLFSLSSLIILLDDELEEIVKLSTEDVIDESEFFFGFKIIFWHESLSYSDDMLSLLNYLDLLMLYDKSFL